MTSSRHNHGEKRRAWFVFYVEYIYVFCVSGLVLCMGYSLAMHSRIQVLEEASLRIQSNDQQNDAFREVSHQAVKESNNLITKQTTEKVNEERPEEHFEASRKLLDAGKTSNNKSATTRGRQRKEKKIIPGSKKNSMDKAEHGDVITHNMRHAGKSNGEHPRSTAGLVHHSKERDLKDKSHGDVTADKKSARTQQELIQDVKNGLSSIQDHEKNSSIPRNSSEPIVPFVFMVHKRVESFKIAVESLLASDVDVKRVPIIISHDGKVPEMISYVESLKSRFDKVIQIFHPFSCYDHPHSFPGNDETLNDGYAGDAFGKKRNGSITCCRHHFTWMMKTVFDMEFKGVDVNAFMFMEEDYMVAPTIYETILSGLNLYEKFSRQDKKGFFGLTFGREFVPLEGREGWFIRNFKTGPMVLTRDMWKKIRRNAKEYCTFDDYNWDWSLVHLMDLQLLPSSVLCPTVPQVWHIGVEKGMHDLSLPAPNLKMDLPTMLPEFHGKSFVGPRVPHMRQFKTPYGNGGFGHPADHKHCLSVMQSGENESNHTEEFDSRHDFAFLIPSGCRTNGAFYANDTLLALKQANVPASSIEVLNFSGGEHKLLIEFLDGLKDFKVNVIERDAKRYPLEPPFTFDVPEKNTSQFEEAELDSGDRKKWRTQEALDFIQLAQHGLNKHSNTDWFIFLQDDAVISKLAQKHGFVIHAIHKIIELGEPFVSLNEWGNVAFVIHRQLLEGFVGFATTRYTLLPIDYLLQLYLQSQGIVNHRKVSLFDHIGEHSTLLNNNGSRPTNYVASDKVVEMWKKLQSERLRKRRGGEQVGVSEARRDHNGEPSAFSNKNIRQM